VVRANYLDTHRAAGVRSKLQTAHRGALMKHAVLVGIAALFISGNAAATCYGSSTYRTCTDASGNSYTTQKIGNSIYTYGYNAQTGSSWSQSTQRIGNNSNTPLATTHRETRGVQTASALATPPIILATTPTATPSLVRLAATAAARPIPATTATEIRTTRLVRHTAATKAAPNNSFKPTPLRGAA